MVPALKELKIQSDRKNTQNPWQALSFLREEYVPIKFDEAVKNKILWDHDQEEMGS